MNKFLSLNDVLYNYNNINIISYYQELILTFSSVLLFFYIYFEFAMYDIYCPFYPEMYTEAFLFYICSNKRKLIYHEP